MGIDFGTEFMKVALVQPGAPLEIVTNKVSKRKTETAVAFVRGERLFASDAYGMLSRKPEQAYSRLTEFLGRSDVPPRVSALTTKSYLPMTVRFNETRGAIAIGAPAATTAEYGGGWSEWTPEELVAMILSYAKEITRDYGGNVVRDCVITVPSFATQLEREAMLVAAELADMRVLSLIEANTAAALQFGLDRKYEEKKTILFYNVGAENIQASLVEYSTFLEKQPGNKNKTVGQLEVVGKGWLQGAGGFAVDLALTELIADGFNAKWNAKKHKGDVRTLARPMAKIRASAKKTKEVLSANEKIPVSIPSLHDDIDFSMTLTRKDLEDAAADVLAASTKPIVDALDAANLTVDDIDGVEIIGGGVRVPKIQQTLRDFFAERKTNKSDVVELSVHLNGDEAVALGAAFHGANVSTSFRVRKVGMMDYTPFPVGVKMANDPEAPSLDKEGGLMGFFKGGTKDHPVDPDWRKGATLFKKGARLGAKPRTIAFHHEADIVCELAYDDDAELPDGTPRTIALYNISGIAAFAAEMAKQNTSGTLPRPKVQLSFTLDSSGVSSLSKAEVSVVEEYKVDAPPPEEEKKKDDKKKDKKKKAKGDDAPDADANATDANATLEGDAEASEKASEDQADAKASEETASEGEAPAEGEGDGAAAAAADANATDANATDANGTAVTPGKILKKKTHKRALTVTPSVAGLKIWAQKKSDVADAADRLAHIAKQEALRMQREGAKNDLEAAIYKVRNEMSDKEDVIAPVSTAEQREAVSSLSLTLEDWLYESDDAPTSEFTEKREALEAAWEAIVVRAEEAAARPKAVAKFTAALEVAKLNATEVWATEKPWLAQLDLDDLVAKVDKAAEWLEGALAKQAALEPSEDPAFKVAELAAKLKPVATLATRLAAKKKPIEAKVVSNATDANATDAEASEAEEAKTEEEKAEEAKVEQEMNDEL